MAYDVFLHHVGLYVADVDANVRFYTAALAPLGIVAGAEYERGVEFWREGEDTPSLGVDQVHDGDPVTSGVHLAFCADSRAGVDAFFAAAVAAGGEPRHAPRFWPEYRAYCAFVSDPGGNNVEALIKEIPA